MSQNIQILSSIFQLDFHSRHFHTHIRVEGERDAKYLLRASTYAKNMNMYESKIRF